MVWYILFAVAAIAIAASVFFLFPVSHKHPYERKASRHLQYSGLPKLHDPSEEEGYYEVVELLEQACHSIYSGEFETALERCDKISKEKNLTDIQKAFALLSYIFCYKEMGEYEKALYYSSRYLEFRPVLFPSDITQALKVRGECFERLGRNEEALDEWANIINVPGVDSGYINTSLFNRADLLYRLMRYDEASELLEKILKAPDASPDKIERALSFKCAILQETGKFDEAMELCNAVIGQYSDPFTKANVGIVRCRCLLAKNEIDKALEGLKEIANTPDVPSTLKVTAQLQCAVIELGKGNPQEAIKHATEVMGSPDASLRKKMQSRLISAKAFMGMENAKRAVEEYQAVLDMPDYDLGGNGMDLKDIARTAIEEIANNDIDQGEPPGSETKS